MLSVFFLRCFYNKDTIDCQRETNRQGKTTSHSPVLNAEQLTHLTGSSSIRRR